VKVLKSFQFWFWMIAVMGVSLRLREFFSFRSLWLDEVALLLQIQSRSYQDLLSSGVSGNQGAPAAYLLLSKVAMSQLSWLEVGARLVSLLSGVMAVAVAARLVLVSFHDSLTRIVALVLIATSPWLVYYSAEGKHYMLEVLVALLLVVCALRYELGSLTLPKMALLGGVAVWFSHNAPVVLCGCGTTLILRALVGRDVKKVGAIVAMCGFWVLSFGFHAATNMRNLFGNQALFQYWGHGLAPWREGFPAVVRWIGHAWAHLVAYVFMPSQPHLSSYVSSPWLVSAWEMVLVALMAIGLARMFRERSPLALYVATIIGVSFALALLRISPFSSRLVLYTAPFLLLTAASGVVALVHRARTGGILVVSAAMMSALLVVGPSVATSTGRLIRPINRNNMKGALWYLSQVREGEDPVLMRQVDATVAAIYMRSDRSLEIPLLESNWEIARADVMCARLRKRIARAAHHSIWVVGVLKADKVAVAIDELKKKCVTVTAHVQNDEFFAARIALQERSTHR